MTTEALLAFGALGLVLLVVGGMAGAAWLGRKSQEGRLEREDRRADEAEKKASAAEEWAEYERRKAKIIAEGERRAAEVDRNGPDPERIRRLLRGERPPDSTA